MITDRVNGKRHDRSMSRTTIGTDEGAVHVQWLIEPFIFHYCIGPWPWQPSHIASSALAAAPLISLFSLVFVRRRAPAREFLKYLFNFKFVGVLMRAHFTSSYFIFIFAALLPPFVCIVCQLTDFFFVPVVAETHSSNLIRYMPQLLSVHFLG